MRSKGGSRQFAKQVDAIYKAEKEFITKVLKFLPSKSTEWRGGAKDESESFLNPTTDPTTAPEVRSNKRLKLLKKKKLKKLLSKKPKPKPTSAAEVVDKNDRTPLKKASVKKGNGEIVYSKFDFISDDRKPKEFTINPKPVIPDKLLKVVEKKESVIKKLKETGEVSKAVAMEEKQKWNNALQRAKGTKVKDDPALLKKSIKKMDKIKQVKQKKWTERVDFQEKLKNQRQNKRQANIQAKKDEKVKKQKKILRKKGRIA